jgi:response regulator RpfG family c-di-GMP phosphodiesterase
MMPGMDGIELAQMVRARKKTQHVPILLLTAHAPDSMMAGYAAGAVDFLTKPIQFQVLRSKVAIFADLFRHRHALAESNRALEAEIEERRQVEERVRQLNEEIARRVTDLGVANAELESFSYTIATISALRCAKSPNSSAYFRIPPPAPSMRNPPNTCRSSRAPSSAWAG